MENSISYSDIMESKARSDKAAIGASTSPHPDTEAQENLGV